MRAINYARTPSARFDRLLAFAKLHAINAEEAIDERPTAAFPAE
jgi:hypothetical protein